MSNLREAITVNEFATFLERSRDIRLFDQCIDELDRDELLVALVIAMDQYKSAVAFHDSHIAMSKSIEAARHRFGRW